MPDNTSSNGNTKPTINKILRSDLYSTLDNISMDIAHFKGLRKSLAGSLNPEDRVQTGGIIRHQFKQVNSHKADDPTMCQSEISKFVRQSQ